MAKILITGGAGFIGFHLASALAARGDRVDLLDNFTRAVRDPDLASLLDRPGVRFIERDLLAPDATADLDADYDVIYHLAAIIGVTYVLKSPYDVLVKNSALLGHVIDFARRQRALRALVFASTSEVYAGTLKSFGMQIPTPETTPLTVGDLSEARTSYMLSKIYGEAMCRHSGLPAIIVRPHNVYGPRMGLSHVVPELLKRTREAAEGSRLQVYSAGHRRSFCYIDDAVDLLTRIIDAPRCVGVALNLGSNEPEISMGDLASLIMDVVGRRLEIEPMPETAGSPTRRAPDMTLARELTGYTSRADLKTGVTRTYDWYLRNVFSGHGVSAR